MADLSIPTKEAEEVPTEIEALPDKPDAEPAIEELTPIEESATPAADGEAIATEELVVQEDLEQAPVAEEQVTTPTDAETVPAA